MLPSSLHTGDAPFASPHTSSAASSAPRVLIVDDEDAVRAAFARFLHSRGYEVNTARSGADALTLLHDGVSYPLMLCDVRMPGLSGLDLMSRALTVDPDIAVLMLTAADDATTATTALAGGAYDYLVKPVEPLELHEALQRALHRRGLQIAQRRAEAIIRQEVAARTEELDRERMALRSLTVGVAGALINAMEAKDAYLRGHSQRLAELAASIANEMQLDVDTIEAVRLAGRLADVGKIGVRESVLNKPDTLTAEEYEHVKDHVRISMEILAPLKHLGVTLDYVQDHHEHFDGTGYPRGLTGAEASLGGRILHMADAFVALTSRRAYRDSMTQEETIAHLAASAGRRFDPDIFDALRRVVQHRQSLVFIDDIHG